MNMIVTCARHFEPETRDELNEMLSELGDPDALVTITDMSGILTVDTDVLDSVKIVKDIRDAIREEPWSVRYCMRMIPIQDTVKTDVMSIREAVSSLSGQIQDSDKYRISIEKRNSDISSKEIITKIADSISNKVSLEHPDKVILIEVLGGVTGVSILDKDGILSVERTKRSMSDE